MREPTAALPGPPVAAAAAARPVRSYQRRGGRTGPTQAAARRRLWSRWGVEVDGRPLDLDALFGRTAPVALEIGFGMGEAAVAMAEAQPQVDLIAVDVHTRGHGALLGALDARGLTNVRVVDGDAVAMLADSLAPASLHAVRIFFPDPWPKRRHAKRRLVTPAFAALLADRLVPGGSLHLATDWPPYADQVRSVLAASPAFAPADDVPWRPPTAYERRGLAQGRPPHDVAAVRLAGVPGIEGR